ncbi:MAG: amidohydrolase family protein, partial [Clostridia bacterium]|nr:amidohydrolase family protein [Clostridia bacterium]
MRILIKNGRVIDPENGIDKVTDIFVDKGIISEIGDDLELDGIEMEVIDATGKIVTPGLVDMHCHLRDPGQEYKEDIETGTRAAVMGGITSVACMPNTKPVVDNEAVV